MIRLDVGFLLNRDLRSYLGFLMSDGVMVPVLPDCLIRRAVRGMHIQAPQTPVCTSEITSKIQDCTENALGISHNRLVSRISG